MANRHQPWVRPCLTRRLPWLFGLWLGAVSLAWGRGGGGCVEEGTLIWTPAGEIPVEQLAPGDEVWTLVDGRLRSGTVRACLQVRPWEYWELNVADRFVRVTAEHPFQVKPGVFRIASELRPGQTLYRFERGRLETARLLALRRVRAERPAYNLLVSPGGTFLANDVLVHNKGCFLPDTPIRRADGTESRIRDLRVGDAVLAFTADGALTNTTVREVLTHEVDEYAVVTTERIALRVTVEHPFYVGRGTFKTLEALRIGDWIFACDGQGLAAQRITGIRHIREQTLVYNLQTDSPHTFFAQGVAVHNKGGFGGGFHGGYHGGFSGSGGAVDVPPAIVFGLLAMIVLVAIVASAANNRRAKDEDLDFTYRPSAVAPKAIKTQKLLAFIAKTDPSFQPATLESLAKSTFVSLQSCWQARSYEPMKALLMPDLYAEHCAQIDGLVRDHEINRIDALQVERVDLVNVRYTRQENQREFTALITATARDYYTDDRTGEFLRGDEAPARFQEFWTFHRQGGAWLLREIDQSRESDALKQENFFEPFTDQGLQQVYAEAASPGGPAGPWVESETQTKSTRIERLLNFLVQTDKLWDRDQMIERARQVYTRVILARESGDPEAVPAGDLFPEAAAHLQAELVRQRAAGSTLELRNFCVRKVDLVLVRNFEDHRADEFTARISAHAQRVVRRNGLLNSQDEYVSPFVEFWTFGRLDGQWKLKEVLPPAQGEAAVAAENVDEASSRDQLQWYYQKTRAT